MVRQYIGARYVPRFYENSVGTPEWVNGVIYEPLTIVTYNGNSYTSKKTVPANIGDPSANPTYWAATGLYNAQVEALRQDVVAVQADVNDMQDEIDNLQSAVTHPKTVFVTDSYGSSVFSGITNFCEKFRELGGYTTGTDFDYSHLDGAGFVSDGRVYTTPLTALYNRLSGDMAPDKIERVAILGGCNDAILGVDQITPGMETTLAMAQQYFPNAVIYVGCIGGLVSNRGGIYKNAACAYSRCASYGGRYLPNLEFIMMNEGYFQNDGVHPNQSGMNAIAAGLLNALEKGYSDHPLSERGNLTLDSAWTSGNVPVIIEAYNNEISFVMRSDPTLGCESRTLSGNVVLGTLTSNLLNGNAETVFPVYGLVTTNGVSTPINTFGIILNKTVYIVFQPSMANCTALVLFRSRFDMIRGLV